MSGPGPALVLAYRRTGKFAFHALIGALERDPELAATPVIFATSDAEMAAAIVGQSAAGHTTIGCWSFYSPDFTRAAGGLQAVRARTEGHAALHLAGGVHATAEAEQTLRAGFDLVALGEGEVVLLELLRTVRAGADPRESAGIASLRGGQLRRNPRPPPIELDDYPPFALGHRRFGPIEITRGCAYACKFCQTPFFSKARFRNRSVENVCHWVAELRDRGFRDYRFLTPTSLSYGTATEEPDLAAVDALLQGVRQTAGPHAKIFYGTFPSEVRPEHVSAEALAILRRWIDNDTLILGGQSGSDRVLERSGRGHRVADIERAVALCIEAGFVPHIDFLFGLPGEDREDVEDTLRLAERLSAAGGRIHGHTFMPLPGTPLQDAPPGRIDPHTHRRLLRLASRGDLYGQWERQIEVARSLADGRARR